MVRPWYAEPIIESFLVVPPSMNEKTEIILSQGNSSIIGEAQEIVVMVDGIRFLREDLIDFDLERI